MKEFAARLLELDRQAQSLLEEAAADREQLKADAVRQQEAILREYETHAREHIETLRQAETSAAQEECAAIRSRYDLLAQELEQTYREQHKDWENELFLRCIG